MPDSTPLLTSLVLRAQQREIEAARHLAQRVALVEAAGRLIHTLQRERGASGAYLTSKGTRFDDVREAAAQEARAQGQQLLVCMEDQGAPHLPAPARMLWLMAWVAHATQALEPLRQQIARQGIASDTAVGQYSRVIAGLIELIFQVADATLLPGISQPLVALVYLVQGNEAAGQERALGTQMLTAGRGTAAQQQRLLSLIDAQDHALGIFAEYAAPDVCERWKQQQSQPNTASLERMRRVLCTAKPSTPLDSALSSIWFDTSSARLEFLWTLQTDMVQRMRQDCEAHIQAAEVQMQNCEDLLRRLQDDSLTHSAALAPATSLPDWMSIPSELPGSKALVELLLQQSSRLNRAEAELAATQRTLSERKTIERAKGVLMSRLGMTEEAAFRALQKAAMDQNRRLSDVAEAMLAMPEYLFTPVAKAR